MGSFQIGVEGEGGYASGLRPDQLRIKPAGDKHGSLHWHILPTPVFYQQWAWIPGSMPWNDGGWGVAFPPNYQRRGGCPIAQRRGSQSWQSGTIAAAAG
ncbi:hypothetical protein [Rhizobium binxianense]|uniref:hypothetical protein n=1 Tax=Rhizobium binxianense TaxID=3024242 RepID=UPI002362B1BE|nr:hypothetical protein [Rhizobium sp. MJ37]MDC9832615.1 hypothetical protein [Rhizobium sp. MJ37]